MGTLHTITSVNLHNMIDSGCDRLRKGVGGKGRNSRMRILYVHTDFVLFLKEDVSKAGSYTRLFPGTGLCTKLFGLSTWSLVPRNAAETWCG